MNRKLCVSNLSYQTTKTTLSELFGAIGKVVSVRLVTDRVTGCSTGFAFVEMTKRKAARKAINRLDGKTVDGRDIKVAAVSCGRAPSWGDPRRRGTRHNTEERPRRACEQEIPWGMRGHKRPPWR